MKEAYIYKNKLSVDLRHTYLNLIVSKAELTQFDTRLE